MTATHKLLLALAALLLAGSTASATPTLKGEITRQQAIVTIGDMFDDAGALAETGIFLAPRPGTTGIVPLADVQRAAARSGLVDFENVPALPRPCPAPSRTTVVDAADVQCTDRMPMYGSAASSPTVPTPSCVSTWRMSPRRRRPSPIRWTS